MATVMDATETNLLNGDQTMATTAITPASVASGAPTTFLASGTPTSNGFLGIAPLEDTSWGGQPTVPPDVYDKNFGPNYTILYSPENPPDGYYFDGGLGADQYGGYQGDPGNLGGQVGNVSISSGIDFNNQQGGDAAQQQYQLAQAAAPGTTAAEAQAVQTYEILGTKVAGSAPSNAGGNPVLGAAELGSSALAQYIVGASVVIAVIASFAAAIVATPVVVAAAVILDGLAAAAGTIDYFSSGYVTQMGGHSGPGLIPNDANTQTFFNDVGRMIAQSVRSAAAWFSQQPYHNAIGIAGSHAQPLLPASSFSTNTSGAPIFTLPPMSSPGSGNAPSSGLLTPIPKIASSANLMASAGSHLTSTMQPSTSAIPLHLTHV